MNCRRINALISPLIDGELNGDDAMRVRQHLESCASCREEYEAFLNVKRLLSSMATVEPRPGFEEDILSTIASASSKTSWATSLTGWWFTTGPRNRLGVAAAFALVSLIVLALTVRLTIANGNFVSHSHFAASLPGDASLSTLSGRDVGFVHETFGRPQPVSYHVGDSPCLPGSPNPGTEAGWRGYLPVSSSR